MRQTFPDLLACSLVPALRETAHQTQLNSMTNPTCTMRGASAFATSAAPAAPSRRASPSSCFSSAAASARWCPRFSRVTGEVGGKGEQEGMLFGERQRQQQRQHKMAQGSPP